MWKVISFPIHVYRYFLSPCIKPACRFYPNCSQYALSAIEYYGIFKGVWLAMRRILRCHPWAPGGFDPIEPQGYSVLNEEEKP